MGTWRESFTTLSNGYNEFWMIVAFNCLCTCGARLIVRTTVEAEGSGFPEVKAMLFGKPMQNFLTLRVLAVKAICLTLGVGAGLPLGKEGPNVHMAACISARLGPEFYKRKRVAASHLLLAACAVGVGSSFSAPIGGVVFALELVLPQVFDSIGYSGCFLSAVVGSVCYIGYRSAFAEGLYLEPLVSTNVQPGEGALSGYPFFLLVLDTSLGVLCGLAGALWVSMHKQCAGAFKRWRLKQSGIAFKYGSALADDVMASHSVGQYGGGSPTGNTPKAWIAGSLQRAKSGFGKIASLQWRDLFQIIVVTMLNTYFAANLPLLGGKPQPALLNTIFDKTLSLRDDWVLPWAGPLPTMVFCFLMKWFITMMALSLANPAGVVAPVMIIGGLFARCIVEMIPDSFMNLLLITPGSGGVPAMDRGALAARFAIIGAGAFSSAVCRAFAMAITIFEVLALPNLIIPLATASLAAMFVADKFARPYFDTNLIGRGLKGISDLTHGKEAFKPAFAVMRRLNMTKCCLEKQTTIGAMKAVVQDKDTASEEFFAVVEHVTQHWSDEGVSAVLKGCISRKNAEGILEENAHCADKDVIDLMAIRFIRAQKEEGQAIVNLTPLHVEMDTMVQDVYLMMKVMQEPIVFVTHGNLLQGTIMFKELLGHKINSEGGAGWAQKDAPNY